MCEVAKALGLKAKDRTEERLLEYLNKNCSDMLAFKIQAGKKTLSGAVDYIKKEVEKTIKKGARKGQVCVMVDDAEVFGMLIHFFEEDSIEEPKDKPKPKPAKKPEPVKKDKPKSDEPSMENPIVMDLFGEGRPF